MCSLLLGLLPQFPALSSPQFIFYHSLHEVLSRETENVILVKKGPEKLPWVSSTERQCHWHAVSPPGSASPSIPVSSAQMLYKAAPPHLLVLVPTKIKGTQGLRAEYVFVYTKGKK